MLRVPALVLLALLGLVPARAAAAEPVSLTGRVVTVAVDRAGGGAEEQWLHSAGRHLRLRRAAGRRGAELPSGTQVEVRGELAGATVVADAVQVTAPAAAPEAAARRRVLVMLVHWTGPDAVTPASATAQVGATDGAWFAAASHGRLGIEATATPWLALPASSCSDYYGVLARAREAARARGLDPAAYDHEMVYFPRDPACGAWAGMAEIGGRVSWINGAMDTRATVHELGHNLGLRHAGAVTCRDGAGIPVTLRAGADGCSVDEYGDPFDAMGSSTHAGHFSAGAKHALGWLAGRTQTVTADASVTLAPVESSTGVQGAVIPTAAGGYWVEYRRPQGLDAFLSGYPGATDGVLIRAQAASGATHLLDLRPDAGRFLGDAALPAGASWTTPEGIAIRVDAASGTEATISVRMPGAATASGAGNLVANPSFETSADDWGTWQAAVTREALADAPHGAHVARVARTAGTAYALNDVAGGLPPTVSSTAAGARYAAAASVRAGSAAAVGRPIRLVLRETTPAGVLVRESSGTGTLGSTFRRLGVEAVTPAAGNRIDVRVSQSAAVAGDAFLVDDLSVVRVRDTTAPAVTAVAPADGAAGVPADAVVTATFSEPMDAAATAGALSLVRTADGAPVAAAASWAGGTVSLRPAVPLTAGTSYTARLSTAARDVAGNALPAAREWRFTTQAVPPVAPVSLIAGGSFESGLTGWTGWQSTISRVALAGAPDGTQVARAARATGTSYALNHGDAAPGTVAGTVAATGYRATAWVRAASPSAAGRPISLIIRERTQAGATVRQWTTAGTLPATTFAQLAATATTAGTGNRLDVRLSQAGAAAGDAFYADDITLVRTG